MYVVMNKCFILNPKKNLEQIRLAVFEKNAKTRLTLTHSNSEKILSPRQRLGYSNNQFNC